MALTTKGIRFSQTTADCSPHSNASLILLYNCPNFRYFSSKIFDAFEFAKINIFGIGIHHTSLLGIWFAWTLSVLTLIVVKATRDMSDVPFQSTGNFSIWPSLILPLPLDYHHIFCWTLSLSQRRRNSICCARRTFRQILNLGSD